jgi:hypothetical protein
MDATGIQLRKKYSKNNVDSNVSSPRTIFRFFASEQYFAFS